MKLIAPANPPTTHPGGAGACTARCKMPPRVFFMLRRRPLHSEHVEAAPYWQRQREGVKSMMCRLKSYQQFWKAEAVSLWARKLINRRGSHVSLALCCVVVGQWDTTGNVLNYQTNMCLFFFPGRAQGKWMTRSLIFEKQQLLNTTRWWYIIIFFFCLQQFIWRLTCWIQTCGAHHSSSSFSCTNAGDILCWRMNNCIQHWCLCVCASSPLFGNCNLIPHYFIFSVSCLSCLWLPTSPAQTFVYF